MKKICWISDYPLKGSSFGGVTYELASKLQSEYIIDCLCLGYKGIPLKLMDNFRVFELENAHQLRYYFKKLQPDITVVFHSFWLTESMINELPHATGKTILYIPIESHEIPMEYKGLFTKFDRILTPSEFSKKSIKKLGIESHVVPHGVDKEFFKRKPKKDWHEFRFGYIGMNDVRKQVPRVIEAYSRLGKGTLALALPNEGQYNPINLAKHYNVSPVFIEPKLLGLTLSKEAVRDFYESLDVLIVPASEGWGIPLVEAGAMGVPSIASSIGASKEVLGSGGLYCNVSDYLDTSIGKVGLISVADLYRKMRFISQVPDVYEKLSVKAYENSVKWTWSDAVAKLKENLEF